MLLLMTERKEWQNEINKRISRPFSPLRTTHIRSRCNPVPPPYGESASAELTSLENRVHCLKPPSGRRLPMRVGPAPAGLEPGT